MVDWAFGVVLFLFFAWVVRVTFGILQPLAPSRRLELMKGEMPALALCCALVFLVPKEECRYLTWFFAGFTDEVARQDWTNANSFDPDDPHWYRHLPDVSGNLTYLRKRLGLVRESGPSRFTGFVKERRAIKGIIFARRASDIRDQPDHFAQVAPNVYCFLSCH